MNSSQLPRQPRPVVYEAMISTINVPKDDRFQIITEHTPVDFIADPNYLGVQRSPDCVIIQVTLNEHQPRRGA